MVNVDSWWDGLTRDRSEAIDEITNQLQAVTLSEDRVDDLWFYVTAKGLRAVRRLQDRDTEKP